MRPSPPLPSILRVATATALAVVAGAVVAATAEPEATEPGASEAGAPEPFFREPPEKIVTAEACGECHVSAYAVWEDTHHATGFKTLHRSEAGEAIAGKMGFRLLKRDSLCLRCHYTPKVERGQLRAVSGVSCESCHGAARDWIDVHNDYGPGNDYASEPPEHRAERIAASRAAGMRRPSDLYGVAASCLGCHTVPEERLVNVGGHTTGSVDFELVAWSQGEICHNFLRSFLAGAGTENRPRGRERKRPMYVLGRLVDLEYSLRAAAEATENGTYARAIGRRVRTATVELRKIGQLAELPEIAEAVETVRAVRVVPGNREPLLAAAETVGAAARRFAGRDVSPMQLAALDPLVEGRAVELAPADRLAASDPGGEGGPAAGPVGGETAGPGAGDTTGAASVPAVGGRPTVGEIKRRIRPASGHRTLGPGACAGCHQQANDWWAGNAHYHSAEPFFQRSAKNVEIALLYGLEPEQAVLGTAVCMDCHGTVVSGSESFEVFDGASCESCHGPAGDYIEKHKEGDESLGERRPGYQAALRLGMVELADFSTRAQTCTGCHYITDRRLLSAGHPSGEGFDYVAGMAEVKHWPGPPAPAGPLRAAFSTVLAARGPVPDVPRAEPSQAVAEAAAVAAAAPSAGSGPGAAWDRARPATATSGGGSAAGSPRGGRGRGDLGLDLPSLPAIDESASIEEVLLLLERRLELLYDAVGGPVGNDGSGGQR